MSAAVVSVVGRVKFWDVPRGFGFLVSDALDGDVLIHRSILRGHSVRILPEGTIAEVDVQQGDRGLQASRIISLDLRDTHPPRPANTSRRTTDKMIDEPGEWECCEGKWFALSRGFGFMIRNDGSDVFVHAVQLRDKRISGDDICPGRYFEVRIAHTDKGQIAAEVRRCD